jgi:prepilin-type N-terminal cleavage/methylation domain-containing protein
MRRQYKKLQNEKGFTLLEAIITLVLVSILGAMFFEFMGPQLTGSPLQVLRVKNQYELIQEIERLTGLYRDELNKGTLDINTFKAAHVDTSPYNDNSQVITLTTSGGYTTQYGTILKVNLKNAENKMFTLLTR